MEPGFAETGRGAERGNWEGGLGRSGDSVKLAGLGWRVPESGGGEAPVKRKLAMFLRGQSGHATGWLVVVNPENPWEFLSRGMRCGWARGLLGVLGIRPPGPGVRRPWEIFLQGQTSDKCCLKKGGRCSLQKASGTCC